MPGDRTKNQRLALPLFPIKLPNEISSLNPEKFELFGLWTKGLSAAAVAIETQNSKGIKLQQHGYQIYLQAITELQQLPNKCHTILWQPISIFLLFLFLFLILNKFPKVFHCSPKTILIASMQMLQYTSY